jgi:F-box/leucine-rich repeat protein 2/20
MSDSAETNPSPPNHPNPKRVRARPLSLPDVFFKDQEALKHAILQMQLHHQHHQSPIATSPSPSSPTTSCSSSSLDLTALSLEHAAPDPTSLLSDTLLLRIFSKLPVSQYHSNSLVCKRWLFLHGRLVQSLKLLDWGFLDSGRLFRRFANVSEADIVRACIRSRRNSGILVTHKAVSVHVNSNFSGNGFIGETDFLPTRVIDQGLKSLAESYPNLRRLVAIGASEDGLLSVAKECQILQELELHCCGDLSLRGISGFTNLQIVKLVGWVDGFYGSVVSDIGLTILAQGCRRLVRLELCGCEGSYDGIKAIGQCCQMLEEMILRDHRMDAGWLAALSYCGNLKTLRLQSCRSIDSSPGPDEHLGLCKTLESLHLQRCQMRPRDQHGVRALFLVCREVREIVLQDCWGLENEVFGFAGICRYELSLSLCCTDLLQLWSSLLMRFKIVW